MNFSRYSTFLGAKKNLLRKNPHFFRAPQLQQFSWQIATTSAANVKPQAGFRMESWTKKTVEICSSWRSILKKVLQKKSQKATVCWWVLVCKMHWYWKFCKKKIGHPRIRTLQKNVVSAQLVDLYPQQTALTWTKTLRLNTQHHTTDLKETVCWSSFVPSSSTSPLWIPYSFDKSLESMDLNWQLSTSSPDQLASAPRSFFCFQKASAGIRSWLHAHGIPPSRFKPWANLFRVRANSWCGEDGEMSWEPWKKGAKTWADWWFQPIWKILVKLEIFPK